MKCMPYLKIMAVIVDKPKKNVCQNLKPVTIMVVDTISSVRSKRLLKILLDSGSTTTLVNKKC